MDIPCYKSLQKITILQNFGTMELWLTMEKLYYYGKSYGTIDKTLVLY